MNDKKYINSSHLAILSRLALFPDKPIELEYLREYISNDIDDNIRCLNELQALFPFLTVKYFWNEGQIIFTPKESPSFTINNDNEEIGKHLNRDAQIILDIINATTSKHPKTDDYKERLDILKEQNFLGAAISIKENRVNEAKIWLETYLEDYKNGNLKGNTNMYKFKYNLKVFLQYLENSNYELSSYTLNSYDTELKLVQNRILDTILYLNKRKHLVISDFKIIKAADEDILENKIYEGPTNDLSEAYIRWACTLEFQQLPEDIWRQETIRRDLLFSPREWDILENIMLKEDAIADKLGISIKTVNSAKKIIFRKLKVHNKRDAYLRYERRGSKFMD